MTQKRSSDVSPAFVGLPTFMRLPWVNSAEELRDIRPDAAIIGAPVDMGVVHRPGARFGPRAIRQADYYASDYRLLYHMGLEIYPMERLTVVDYGDANCPPSDLAKSHEAIRAKVTEALEAGAVPMVLGGDHSITLPVGTAVGDFYGHGKVGMVHFDAHADTADASYGGVLISHGSPMRRLIESGAIPGKNFVQVGLRGYWPGADLFEWMGEQGMRWHKMAEIESRGFDAVLTDAIDEALAGPEHVYLSVDIDVIDPGHAPGTGTPEPGGITTAEMLRAVRRIATSVDVVALDVVEVSPPYDGPGEVTAQAAHRVVMEAISGIAWRRAQG